MMAGKSTTAIGFDIRLHFDDGVVQYLLEASLLDVIVYLKRQSA